MGKPQRSDLTPASTSDRLVDRQLHFPADSVRTIKKATENHELVDMQILTSYQEKIRSLNAELQGARKEVLLYAD